MMNKATNICPICEEGQLHNHIGQTEVEYKGVKVLLPLHYSECDCCGSEQASAIETRDNKRTMIAFKKEVDGLLTGADIKALRKDFAITQTEAASIFGGGPVAFSKYEADDVTQSEPMDKLLRLAKAIPEAFAWLKKQARRCDHMSMPAQQRGFAIMENVRHTNTNIVRMDEWKTSKVEPLSNFEKSICPQTGLG